MNNKSKEEDLKDGIKDVINGLFSGIEAGNAEAYAAISDNPTVKKAVASAEKGDQEEFYIWLLYPISGLIDGIVSSVTESHEAKFLLKHGNFVEQHFNKLINKYEGMACCSDKSRTIMRSLLRFYMHGKEIKFDREQEYTYHLPTKIFTEHDEIVEFFNGLYHLYYGNPERYLKALAGALDNE